MNRNNNAQTARKSVSQAKLSDPDYVVGRIKYCIKEIRKRENNLIYYEEIRLAIEANEDKRKLYDDRYISIDNITTWITREQKILRKVTGKLEFLEHCLKSIKTSQRGDTDGSKR